MNTPFGGEDYHALKRVNQQLEDELRKAQKLQIIDQYTRKATLIRVVDGDTVDLNIDLGWEIGMIERVRLAGIDTPEIRGKEKEAGNVAKQFVINWFKPLEFVWLSSVDYSRGKFGRTLGRIYSPDLEELNEVLLRTGLATITGT